MRGFTLLLLLVSARVVHADVSDSGNLTIGGQAVISGTITAPSAVLTAGGSGVYGLTVSSGIRVLNGPIVMSTGAYILWADNHTSTTSAGGGAGGVVLNATQTFTGATSFTSSVTAGPTAYTSALTTSNGLFVNGWTLVGSTSAYSAPASSFTSVQSSTTYHFHASLVNGAAVLFPILRFNGDSGANYNYNSVCMQTTPNFSGSAGGKAKTAVSLVDPNNGVTASTYLVSDVWFETRGGDPRKVVGRYESLDNRGGNGDDERCIGVFTYNGSAAISSVQFLSNGTAVYTGYLSVEQFTPQVHP